MKSSSSPVSVPAFTVSSLDKTISEEATIDTNGSTALLSTSFPAIMAVVPDQDILAPIATGFRIEVIDHGVRIIHDPSAPTNENNSAKYDNVSNLTICDRPFFLVLSNESKHTQAFLYLVTLFCFSILSLFLF